MRFEGQLGYMEKLICDKYYATIEEGWTLDDMCAMLQQKQVWQFVYTVNNRDRAKVRRENNALGWADSPIEHHATQASIPPSPPPNRLVDHLNIRGSDNR